MPHTSPEIFTSRVDALGVITLSRPRALHSLTTTMCDAMGGALRQWQGDPSVAAVLIEHAPGTRGFCAGGDVVAVRASVLEDGGEKARAFFLSEYRLNHLIHIYPKPVIAFMDGVTMGGGAGIALPAAFRVATENTLLAMPEGAIGLFPDAGAGHHLAQLPGHLGAFLALTGARLDGAEAMWAGLATHYLAADDLAEAKEAIAREPQAAGDILADLSSPPPSARLEKNAERIDRLFAAPTLEAILAALASDPSDWAAKEYRAVATKCPASAKVALRQLATPTGDFASEMAREYAIVCRMIARPDFAEGVRAVLVDKDNAPAWQPSAPEQMDAAALDAIFAPLPADQEWTPGPHAG
ncbi:enoyl-CoA hydratase/isomerase family protein [Alteraurantiacibacter palmitatis]|uniref:Enoyl-CoA hydratase/isomerase family protein n=1 Tax=Alteraurantiacibacter palmitatis TaxID=2054628 RepID=A0ABV7E2U1_9SPHN